MKKEAQTKQISKAEEPVPLELQKKTAAEQYIEEAKAFEVTPESRVTAIEKLSEIKHASELAESERDKLLAKPAKEVKDIKSKWKPALDFFEEADEILRAKVKAHDKAVKDKALEDLKNLDTKVESGYISRPETIERNTGAILGTLAPRVTVTAAGSAQTRQVAKLKIDDLSLIPDEYWKLDEVALRKAVVTEKKTVPGASIEMEDTLAIF